MKDLVIKYKRMQGFRVTDTPGYDTHGLPIEVVTEKKLGIKNKQEIKTFGLDKFISECRAYAESKIPSMNEQFKRLGCTFWDWDNPYVTLKIHIFKVSGGLLNVHGKMGIYTNSINPKTAVHDVQLL